VEGFSDALGKHLFSRPLPSVALPRPLRRAQDLQPFDSAQGLRHARDRSRALRGTELRGIYNPGYTFLEQGYIEVNQQSEFFRR